MELVDVDLLKEEIGNELMSIAEQYKEQGSNILITIQDIYMRLLCKIDSIQKHQTSTDLAVEANKLWIERSFFNYDRLQQVLTMSNKEYVEMASHFANWKKEQMMKHAIPYIVTKNGFVDQAEPFDAPMVRLGIKALDPKGIKLDDVIKIILIKED